MTFAVQLSNAMIDNPWAQIAGGLAFGGVAYLLAAGLLWRLAGSPNSGEAVLIRKLFKIAARVLKRPARQGS